MMIMSMKLPRNTPVVYPVIGCYTFHPLRLIHILPGLGPGLIKNKKGCEHQTYL